MTTYIQTNNKVTVENYPYGFTLKTTLYDYIEFHPKKGYRHCTQTINPKSGRLNNPKKSTYYALLFRYYNEVGHIKCLSYSFNGEKSINVACKFIGANFDLFTSEEITYLYNTCLTMSKVDLQACIIYCGATLEDLKPIYTEFITLATNGLKTNKNNFLNMYLDPIKIEAAKKPDYQPFTVRSVQYL